MKHLFLLILSILCISCNSHEGGKQEQTKALGPVLINQIGEYVVDVFEDSKGNLWFGTLNEGLAKYDGHQLKYFTMIDGLPSQRVTGILEAADGEFCLATGKGLVKFDGENFVQHIIKDEFSTNTISGLFIDSKGTFWVGTWGGVYTFDGKEFTHFPIPYPDVNTMINDDTKNWITEITEDPEGNMWFARDGYGACKYDGKEFTYVLKKNGLLSNNVTEIEFDADGNIWFGTRVAERDDPDPKMRFGPGGVNKLENGKMISFPDVKGLNTSDVYEVHIDKKGNIWISTRSYGVYKYDGDTFKAYDVPTSIMSMLNDDKGNLWMAGAGGLYRINSNGKVENILQDGPWD